MNDEYVESMEALFHPLSYFLAYEYEEKLKLSSSVVSTGFANIDSVIGGGLQPGLYMLFGINGIGKNTLLMQIAENLALQKYVSLIINTEDKLHSLIPQFLSRQSFRNDPQTAISQFNVPNEILKNPQWFQDVEESLHSMISFIGWIEEKYLDSKRVEEIIDFQFKRDDKLVVFINSQVFSPLQRDRELVKSKLQNLKYLIRKYQIPIILMYNLSLEDYLSLTEGKSVIDDIEQLADTSLLLQPNRLNILLKDSQYRLPLYNSLSDNDSMLYELFIRKQKSGIQKQRVYLTFYPQFGFFQEG